MESKSRKLKMLSNKELAMFCDQMAMIIKAGQTPEAGINLLLEGAASDEAKQILEPISKKHVNHQGYFQNMLLI